MNTMRRGELVTCSLSRLQTNVQMMKDTALVMKPLTEVRI
jgi:hypothetical protein